jgi:hypothetical protein
MQFKRSAGVFVGAISLLFAGPLLGVIGVYFGTWAALSKNDPGLNALFTALVVLGGVVSFVGLIMLIVATHRALVKIDALPVRVQATQRENVAANRY